ncbi:VOC family protein [Leptolyngbya sp. FACHB-261]|uniref:VOC family protein n=1 Tax=Leptolyngbya sp. FACHB-261 TaxID=2692806 RepID=UPI001688DBB8|nr:VOC family protein [Leptolyngbya sp. FACHB-261]MBD2100149.1 VOC family protein [Leptolyngbya sp. FACHB-261]
MIDHVSITVSDLKKAGEFYDAIMTALGYPCVYKTEQGIGYGLRNSPEDDSHTYISVFASPKVIADRRHWAFRATSRIAVDRFYVAAVATGGKDDAHGPALRPEYHSSYYAAFVTDPDGNRLEAVCHLPPEKS